MFSCNFCSYSRLYAHREEGWELSIGGHAEHCKEIRWQAGNRSTYCWRRSSKNESVFLCRSVKRIKAHRPDLHIKAFTAVELDYMFRKAKLSVEEGVQVLKEAGLDSIPGGGAEIFDEEIGNRFVLIKLMLMDGFIFMRQYTMQECIVMPPCYMAILKNMSIALIIWTGYVNCRIKQVASIHLFH